MMHWLIFHCLKGFFFTLYKNENAYFKVYFYKSRIIFAGCSSLKEYHTHDEQDVLQSPHTSKIRNHVVPQICSQHGKIRHNALSRARQRHNALKGGWDQQWFTYWLPTGFKSCKGRISEVVLMIIL